MIKKLSVKNFKSIKELQIDCRRVNLFIGNPNTGKSNILESLGLLSWCRYGNRDVSLKEYVRFEHLCNLFCDNLTDKPVEAHIQNTEIRGSAKMGVLLGFGSGKFDLATLLDGNPTGGVNIDDSGRFCGNWFRTNASPSSIKFYKFNPQERYLEDDPSFLMPPNGSNMLVAIVRNPKSSSADIIKDFGLDVVWKPHSGIFELQKRIDGRKITNYPYFLGSETMQKAIFYTVAIESNENSTLVFDNPGSGMAPEYISYLGEKIAFDGKNQYFIATHNPYLFLSILEKTIKDDVSVFITYTKDYQTKVKCLNDEETSEIMVYDPFANIDKFIDT